MCALSICSFSLFLRVVLLLAFCVLFLSGDALGKPIVLLLCDTLGKPLFFHVWPVLVLVPVFVPVLVPLLLVWCLC